MKTCRFVVAMLALFWCVGSARADVLGYTDGGSLKGTLEEVMFQVKGIPTLQVREDVATLTVLAEGDDVLVLKNGAVLKGKLASVRFRSVQGHMALGRKEVKSVVVTTPAEFKKPKRDESGVGEEVPDKPKPVVAQSPEQQAALKKNAELYKTYLAKADATKSKDIDSFAKKNKSEWESVNRDIERLAKSIERKRWRRKSADRTHDNDRQYGSEYNRLLRTDGLGEDERDLAKARNKRSKLKKSLGKQRDEIDDSAKKHEKKVKAIAVSIRRQIRGGTVLTEEQMTARYDKALGIKTKGKKGTKKH